MDDSTKKLIEIVNQEPQLRRALENIIEFKWVRVNELSRAQLQMLEEEGFRFHRQTMGSRKEDVKQYLKEHPECRAGDTNGIIDSIGFRLLLEDEDTPEAEPTNFEAEMRHKEEKEQSRRSRSHPKTKMIRHYSHLKVPKKKHQRSPRSNPRSFISKTQKQTKE